MQSPVRKLLRDLEHEEIEVIFLSLCYDTRGFRAILSRFPCNVFLVCYAPTVMVLIQSGSCQKTNDAFRNMPATLLPALDTNGINPWVNIVPLPTTSRLPIRPCIQTSFSQPILNFPTQLRFVRLYCPNSSSLCINLRCTAPCNSY